MVVKYRHKYSKLRTIQLPVDKSAVAGARKAELMKGGELFLKLAFVVLKHNKLFIHVEAK